MIIHKITLGYVLQSYDTELGKFTEQKFHAEDGDGRWEDEDGEPFMCPPQDAYLFFDMVQPEKKEGS